MFGHASVSLVRELTTLIGVVLLVASVLDALVMWLAVVSLGVGLSLLAVECLGSLVSARSCTTVAVPPAAEPNKES